MCKCKWDFRVISSKKLYSFIKSALGPKSQKKSPKRSSCASRPGVSKKCRISPKGPEKESKRRQYQCSGTFSTLFWHFWGVFSGLGGVETPVYGDCNRNSRTILGSRHLQWEIFCQHSTLGKTKTLQTVTLRVAILSDFSARRLSQNFGAKLKQKSAQVRAVFSWKFAGTE